MKPSQFYKIEKDEKFISLFRQVMTMIISEIIIYYSERNEQGEFIRPAMYLDRFERRIRDFAYQKANEGDGAMDVHAVTVRALFDLTEQDDFVYDETGEIDMDASFPILYQKIKQSGLFNIIADAKPEDLGAV